MADVLSSRRSRDASGPFALAEGQKLDNFHLGDFKKLKHF